MEPVKLSQKGKFYTDKEIERDFEQLISGKFIYLCIATRNF